MKLGQLLITDGSVTEIPDLPRVEVDCIQVVRQGRPTHVERFIFQSRWNEMASSAVSESAFWSVFHASVKVLMLKCNSRLFYVEAYQLSVS